MLSTKDKIMKTSLKLFAERGYEGTTMSEIAKGVKIKKASIYAHFASKEELFYLIYKDLEQEYLLLMNKIINDSSSNDIKNRLYYIFEQYIEYYMKNPEIEAFWNQIMLFTPSHITESFYNDWMNCNTPIEEELSRIFELGMTQGLIRKGDAKKMVISFLAYRDGLMYWMKTSQEISETDLRYFIDIYWLGLKDG
ncbi:MAG: TetR/AcrR family transcriptional regulator [Peptococcaceae bacterium]|nr:TetR/AcrR family transcriptional regulator [Peptococcaceae bacterium]